MQVYISPHPDDAVLSCGGRILKTSEKIVVVNVFTKEYEGLTKWDKVCEIANNPMQERITEDKKILSKIEAEGKYLNFYDQAVYEDIKKEKRPSDERKEIKSELTEIINNLSPSKLFFPVGIKHSDHKLLRRIGKEFDCSFYEDLPYGIKNPIKDFTSYFIGSVIEKKIDLILEYKTQIKGLMFLTNTKTKNDLKIKLTNHHFFNNSYYEKVIE